MSGIQPSKLTAEELVCYAELELTEKGLNKAWCEALITALKYVLEEANQMESILLSEDMPTHSTMQPPTSENAPY